MVVIITKDRSKTMKDLGKGIGIGLCGIGIGYATAATGNADCCFAFIALIGIAFFW